MPFDVTSRVDPLRNFKFQVEINYPPLHSVLATMGFTNVSGINMTTDVIPYREGGMNTNYHKLPGQTDFGPLTLIQGVMHTSPGMWLLAKNMFALQQGEGTLPPGALFRFGTIIRVLDHPITKGVQAGAKGNPAGARLAFAFINCWVGSVAFNDLDAAGNAVLISQMTMHHEGFDVIYALGNNSDSNPAATTRVNVH
jgi:phage tail-like protein